MERKIKQQDKKAPTEPFVSKSKKIKFEIHEKLLNFMQAKTNSALIDGRDEIVKNIF
jgi:hypothetical protein